MALPVWDATSADFLWDFKIFSPYSSQVYSNSVVGVRQNLYMSESTMLRGKKPRE